MSLTYWKLYAGFPMTADERNKEILTYPRIEIGFELARRIAQFTVPLIATPIAVGAVLYQRHSLKTFVQIHREMSRYYMIAFISTAQIFPSSSFLFLTHTSINNRTLTNIITKFRESYHEFWYLNRAFEACIGGSLLASWYFGYRAIFFAGVSYTIAFVIVLAFQPEVARTFYKDMVFFQRETPVTDYL